MSENIFDWIEREFPEATVYRGKAARDRMARAAREVGVPEEEIAAWERAKLESPSNQENPDNGNERTRPRE